MKFLKRLDESLEEWLMVGLLIGIGTVMMLQVILRFVFKSPLMWAEEACKYMFVWTSFLSMGYCFRKDMLLKVDLLYSKFGSNFKKIADLISVVLTFTLLITLSIRSIGVVKQIAASGQLSPSLQLPMQYVYAASPVGFFLGLFRYIQSVFRKYVFKTIKEKGRLETTTN